MKGRFGVALGESVQIVDQDVAICRGDRSACEAEVDKALHWMLCLDQVHLVEGEGETSKADTGVDSRHEMARMEGSVDLGCTSSHKVDDTSVLQVPSVELGHTRAL